MKAKSIKPIVTIVPRDIVRVLKILTFTFLLFTFNFITGCRNQPIYKDNRVMMGTFIEVISPSKKAPAIVFSEIRRIEKLLSKYDPESEVSKLNKSGELKASPETFFIIKKSIEFWKQSQGAFDITVAPLLDLWGFSDKKYILPEEARIKAALSLVGSDKILLNNNNSVVKFRLSGMKIDLGAIAKGYALDRAVSKLKEQNISSCLINAGGQVYALGDKFGRPWRIAVKNPRKKGFVDYFDLKDNSVSTSGDYEQFFVLNNKRYAHILNPRTGYPAGQEVISVTVVASDGLTADALSTAVFVLGKKIGLELVNKFSGSRIKSIEENESKR